MFDDENGHFFNKTNANTWVEIENKITVGKFELYSYNTNSIILIKEIDEDYDLYVELNETRVKMAYEPIEELDGENAVSWPGRWVLNKNISFKKGKKKISFCN